MGYALVVVQEHPEYPLFLWSLPCAKVTEACGKRREAEKATAQVESVRSEC